MITDRRTATPFPARRSTGFTLFEILVVISIMGVVTSLGISAFVSLGEAWRTTRTMSDLDREASNAFRMIGQDFASVVSTELSGVSIYGVRRDPEPSLKGRFRDRVLADDAVIIPVPAGASGQADINLISYSVNRADDRHRLVRTIGDVTSQEEETLAEMDVVNPDIAEVIRLRFEYSNGDGQWATGWTDASLPRAVRVSMTLEEPRLGRQHLQITRKAVFAIHVR